MTLDVHQQPPPLSTNLYRKIPKRIVETSTSCHHFLYSSSLSTYSRQALVYTTPGKPASIKSTSGLYEAKSSHPFRILGLSLTLHPRGCHWPPVHELTQWVILSLWNHFFARWRGAPPPHCLLSVLLSKPFSPSKPFIAGGSQQDSVLVFVCFPGCKQLHMFKCLLYTNDSQTVTENLNLSSGL